MSRPLTRPKNGCIAVKVIDHLRDEVMKVFRVYVGGSIQDRDYLAEAERRRMWMGHAG